MIYYHHSYITADTVLNPSLGVKDLHCQFLSFCFICRGQFLNHILAKFGKCTIWQLQCTPPSPTPKGILAFLKKAKCISRAFPGQFFGFDKTLVHVHVIRILLESANLITWLYPSLIIANGVEENHNTGTCIVLWKF